MRALRLPVTFPPLAPITIAADFKAIGHPQLGQVSSFIFMVRNLEHKRLCSHKPSWLLNRKRPLKPTLKVLAEMASLWAWKERLRNGADVGLKRP